ncbi:hypothetical protein [Actimicrobium antarcticum]|uniref:Uncharacterized protein n=1 Tax=Actimicrobium antarcticum TaxID=1051899 RepID=A0ABP7TSQ5_9BURK
MDAIASHLRPRRAALVALLSLGLVHFPLTAAEAPAGDSAATLLAHINTTIGEAACTSNAQCSTIALGAKSCGGPELFLAWSNARPIWPELHQLAYRYTAIRKAQIAASGELSDCRIVVDPGAICRLSVPGQDGHCALQSGPGTTPADPR